MPPDLTLSEHAPTPTAGTQVIRRRDDPADTATQGRGILDTNQTSVAIMQPYIFPYLGYMQLIRASTHFVAYDDVRFIKGGWINRNKICARGAESLFTVPLKGASSNNCIHDVIAECDQKWQRKFFKQLEQEYRRAPHFEPVYDMVCGVFADAQGMPVSELAVRSLKTVADYLGVNFAHVYSSKSFGHTRGLKRAERLVAITRELGAERYINLPGGMALYKDADFSPHGISLSFIFDRSTSYPQFYHPFVPRLSIIDALMHNDIATVCALLDQYEIRLAAEIEADQEMQANSLPDDSE